MMMRTAPLEGEQVQESQSSRQHQRASSSTIAIASRLVRETPRTVAEAESLPALQTVSSSLPHNAGVQQYYLPSGLVLSTGNLLQYFLLSRINSTVRYQSSFTEAQLNTLRRNESLLAYAEGIVRQQRDPAVNSNRMRNQLRQVYVAAAAGMPPSGGGNPPRRGFNSSPAVPPGSSAGGGRPSRDDSPPPNDHDDLSRAFENPPIDPSIPSGDDDVALRIANEIAEIYYAELDLTLEDVERVITKYFPKQENLQTINDAFIDKIVHTRIDKGRYELLALLPDKYFIKAAVEKLKGNNNYQADNSEDLSFFRKIANRISHWWRGSKEPISPLQSYKDSIKKIFDKYISWWKFSWFGHHHDTRARVVKAQIQNSQDAGEIRAILQRQEAIISRKDENQLPKSSWLDNRWNKWGALKNTHANPNTSGYYKVITEALSVKSPSP